MKDVPDAFKKWIENNQERIEKAKSKPYFLSDNPKYAVVQSRQTEVAKPANKVDTFEDVNKKWKTAEGTDAEKYNSCEMAKDFGLVDFRNEVDVLLKKYGLDADASWIRIHNPNRWSFSLRSEDGGFQMSRLFTRTANGIECEHSLFKLSEALQGKGIAKSCFKN